MSLVSLLFGKTLKNLISFILYLIEETYISRRTRKQFLWNYSANPGTCGHDCMLDYVRRSKFVSRITEYNTEPLSRVRGKDNNWYISGIELTSAQRKRAEVIVYFWETKKVTDSGILRCGRRVSCTIIKT